MTNQTREIIDYVRTRRNNGTARERVIFGLNGTFSPSDLLEAARTLLGVPVAYEYRHRVAEIIIDLMYRDTPFDNPPVNEGEQDARARI